MASLTIDWLEQQGCCVEPVTTSLEVADRARQSAEPPILLALFDQAPEAQPLQELLTLIRLGISVVCGVSGTPSSCTHFQALLELGIPEVVALSEKPGVALLSALPASVQRQKEWRGLQRRRERALVKRDSVAALAVALDEAGAWRAYARGVEALGAQSAELWSESGGMYVVARQLGASLPLPPFLASDSQHPVARLPQPGWFEAEELAGFFCDLPDSRNRPGCVVVFPSSQVRISPQVIVAAFAETLASDEQGAVEQLTSHLWDTLGRVEACRQVEDERDHLRRLLAVVSHDLRNPLQTITLAADMLSTAEGAEARELHEVIGRSSRAARRLVQDLLALAPTWEDGGMLLATVDCDVRALLTRVARDAALRARDGRSIRLELAEAITFKLDPDRLDQAVGNLLSNALHYSPAGSCIRLAAHADEHALYLKVENPGEMLTREQLTDVFRPMKRLRRSGDSGSLGLGLHIVQTIVQAHGGEVWAENVADGVRFSIQIARQSISTAPKFSCSESTGSVSLQAVDLPTDLVALKRLFRSPALGELLELWCQTRRAGRLPHPGSLNVAHLLKFRPDLMFARVQRAPDLTPLFRLEGVGARLDRHLRSTLPGSLRSILRDQHQAYLTCLKSAQPTYDSVQTRGAEAWPFERLLLPLCRGVEDNVTDILGLVLFDPTEIPPW